MYSEAQMNYIKEAVASVPIWGTMSKREQERWLEDFRKYCQYNVYDVIEYIMDYKDNMSDNFIHLFCCGFFMPQLWKDRDTEVLYYYECLEKSFRERLKLNLKAINDNYFGKKYLLNGRHYDMICVCETPSKIRIVHLDDGAWIKGELFDINKVEKDTNG